MTTYYVATTGDDSTGDGSSGTPWLTVQHAHDEAAEGDTIKIYPGSYNERLVVTTAGLTIEAQDSEDKPVIWYQATADYQRVVKILRGCTFQNIEIHGGFSSVHESTDPDDLNSWDYMDDALVVGGDSSNWLTEQVIIRGVDAHHVGAAGIMIHYHNSGAATPTIVEDNTVYQTAMRNFDAKCWDSQSPYYDPISPDYTYHPGGNSFTHCHNIVVRNNTVYDVWGEGLPFDFEVVNVECYGNTVGNSYSHKIYVGEVRDGFFYSNLVYSTQDRGKYTGGGLALTDEAYTQNQIDIDNVHFYNNLSIDNRSGIWLAHGYDEHNTKNVYFYHNTIVCYSAYTIGFRAYGSSYQNVNVRNNLFYIGGSAVAGDGGGEFSNVTFGRNVWTVTPGAKYQGTDDIYNSDILLSDPTASISASGTPDPDDYKIGSGSPAINYGDSQLTVDYFGNSRAGEPDTGAHEYDGTAAPPDIDTAADWGDTTKDGLHYNTIVKSGQYGRYFNGVDAFVDMNPTADTFDTDNGAIILRAQPDISGYSDEKAHHLYEAEVWNDTTKKVSFFVIKQSEVYGRLDFACMVEGESSNDAVIIPVEILRTTRGAAWQTFAMTWDSSGDITAYVDGANVGSVAFPGTWAASGFSFIRAGSGGGINYYKGQLAHIITVYGETPDGTAIANISEDLGNNITNTAALDAQITTGSYHWHNLRDAPDETEPEPFVCDFTADDTTAEIPQTVTFDLTSSVVPSGEVVDYVELRPGVGLLTDVVTEDGPTMPSSIAYEYTEIGTYDVIVTIFLTNGESQRLIKREYIEASPPWSEFTCEFTADDTEFEVSQEVTFDLTSCVIPGGFTVDYVKLYPGFGTLQDTVTTDGPSMPTDIAYTYTTPGLHDVRIEIHLVESDLYARETKLDYIQANAAAIGDPDWTDDIDELEELLQMIKDNVALIEAAAA